MNIDDIGLLVLRLGIGLTFAAHGAQKAFGWWGGPGLEGWRGAMHRMGFHPTTLFATISIAVELIGGLFLAIGFLTPFAAAALAAQAVVIIVTAHWPKGFFNSAGGFEFPFALGVAAAAAGLLGPGRISIDNVAGLGWDPTVRVILVIVGLIAGGVATAVPRLGAAGAGSPLRRT